MLVDVVLGWGWVGVGWGGVGCGGGGGWEPIGNGAPVYGSTNKVEQPQQQQQSCKTRA